jgi:hypothetical protein
MNSKMVTVNGKTYQVSCIDGQQFIKAMPSGAHITSEKTRRKPLSSAEKTVSKTFRMTEAQAAKVERLGGAQWVRERIDKAKEK